MCEAAWTNPQATSTEAARHAATQWRKGSPTRTALRHNALNCLLLVDGPIHCALSDTEQIHPNPRGDESHRRLLEANAAGQQVA